MRILLFTGSYPPDKCGVGDYTFHLANALAALPDIEVGVLTGTKASLAPPAPGVTILPLISRWDVRDTLRIMGHMARALFRFRPDIVHIQYPTQGYSLRLAQYFPLIFRLMGCRVVQTWHEHYDECILMGRANFFALDALIYARHNIVERLPTWAQESVKKTIKACIPIGSNMPVVELSAEESAHIKHSFSDNKPIVCFFGFANPNKGVERLFEIANPHLHHLVLICELNDQNPYQAMLLEKVKQAPWAGHVTVTGFQSDRRVAEILAAADAILFPFPGGTDEGNGSLKAAVRAGSFVVATTRNNSLLGYRTDMNIFYASCDDSDGMRKALNTHLGQRKAPQKHNEWVDIAQAHQRVYQSVLSHERV